MIKSWIKPWKPLTAEEISKNQEIFKKRYAAIKAAGLLRKDRI